MEKLLVYLSQPELDANVGYGFIGASFLIYSGIAISMGFYWYGKTCERNTTKMGYLYMSTGTFTTERVL